MIVPIPIQRKEPSPPTALERRTFLRRASHASLLALLSVWQLMNALPARADGTCHYYGCCCLKYPNDDGCTAAYCHTIGGHYYSWNCYSGGYMYTCFECSGGSSCWDPPWYCSRVR